MPRPRPPHLHRETSRHGVTTWYVRRGHGPRIRIKSEFGTAEFEADYRAALDGTPMEHRKKAAVGSLEWLLSDIVKRPHGRSYLLRPGVTAKTSCAACSNKPATNQQPGSGA